MKDTMFCGRWGAIRLSCGHVRYSGRLWEFLSRVSSHIFNPGDYRRHFQPAAPVHGNQMDTPDEPLHGLLIVFFLG